MIRFTEITILKTLQILKLQRKFSSFFIYSFFIIEEKKTIRIDYSLKFRPGKKCVVNHSRKLVSLLTSIIEFSC